MLNVVTGLLRPKKFSSSCLSLLISAQTSRPSTCFSSSAASEVINANVPTTSSNPGGRKTSGVLEQKKAVDKPDLAPPKGTRDFYPEDHRLQQWLFNNWRKTAKEFGFEEYDAPVVENEALFTRKAGEEVTQQLYNFEDKGNRIFTGSVKRFMTKFMYVILGGRRLSLRPEMTPSLARMVLAKGNALPLPIKWFSIPQW